MIIKTKIGRDIGGFIIHILKFLALYTIGKLIHLVPFIVIFLILSVVLEDRFIEAFRLIFRIKNSLSKTVTLMLIIGIYLLTRQELRRRLKRLNRSFKKTIIETCEKSSLGFAIASVFLLIDKQIAVLILLIPALYFVLYILEYLLEGKEYVGKPNRIRG